jgi:predicted nucleic acid-binding protein
VRKKKIFFDSSVYVKVFAQEPGAETVSQLFQLAFDKRIQILLSVWAINKTLVAVDKKNKNGEINEPQKRTILATIFNYAIKWSEEEDKDVEGEVAFVPLDPIIVNKSCDFIIKLHISADDAIHLYTAFIKHCEYFICHDKPLKNNAEGRIPDMQILDITNMKEMNIFRKNLEP